MVNSLRNLELSCRKSHRSRLDLLIHGSVGFVIKYFSAARQLVLLGNWKSYVCVTTTVCLLK
jgi:hypothetical protein